MMVNSVVLLQRSSLAQGFLPKGLARCFGDTGTYLDVESYCILLKQALTGKLYGRYCILLKIVLTRKLYGRKKLQQI